MSPDYSEWLKALKIGDVVGVHGRGHLEIRRVSRTTAKLIILENAHDRYRRSDGSKMPRVRFNHQWIRPVNDADLADVHDRKTREAIKRVDWNTIELSVITEILERLKT